MTNRTPRSILLLLAIAVPFAPAALAHCDTVDGPVAVDAKTALALGDVTTILKWVRAADESEIRAASPAPWPSAGPEKRRATSPTRGFSKP